MTTQYVKRWVITHTGKDGNEYILPPAQGRFTYATQESAQELADAIMRNNSHARLNELYGLPLKVREVDCYPGHHDPVRAVF